MRALDLFCGGGGAARGILAAGFDEVVGIDIADHRKAYPGHFILGDALNPPVRLEEFDFVWASPPCQAFSSQVAGLGRPSSYPNLVPKSRALLEGHPFTVIENVPGAPIRPDVSIVGQAVGLPKLWRKRHFETSFPCLSPPKVTRRGKVGDGTLVIAMKKGSIDALRRKERQAKGMKGHFTKAEIGEAMGLPSDMTLSEMGEAVPPAYAEFIAREALRQMRM